MRQTYKNFLIRDWHPDDREAAAQIVRLAIADYGFSWDPEGADRDAIEVETSYLQAGGELWVVEHQGQIVGTAAYRPFARGERSAEIRKMYLSPEVRGQGLGRYLLHTLETSIAAHGYQQVWLETVTILKEAVRLYEQNGYQQTTGIETQRCDLIYSKTMTNHPVAAHTFGIVLVTAPSQAEAITIANTLVKEHLVACASMMPVTSVYIWEEDVNQDQEWQLILKTRMAGFSVLEARILELHPYEVPEIIAVPLVAGSADYLSWLGMQVS